MKKALGIISNILSLFLVGPFSFYFFVLGLMLMKGVNFTFSFLFMINALPSVCFLCALPALLVGIILSIVFRAKGKYKQSYLIQLLPFAFVSAGVFLFVTSMFWSNP